MFIVVNSCLKNVIHNGAKMVLADFNRPCLFLQAII